MTAEQVAAKFEFSRPGFALVGYEEVALPVYRLRLRALVLERRPLETIHEFILKSVRAGLSSASDVAAFMGLPDAVVKRTFSDLVLAECVHITAVSDARQHGWALTSKGRAALDAAEVTSPEEATFDVDYDGLLRRAAPADSYLYAPKEVRAEGLVEVAAVPNRAPEPEELQFADVGQAMRTAYASRRQKRDLLSIVSIERRSRFFRRAVALIYRGLAADTVQVGLAIEGVISTEHEKAFARHGLAAKMGWDAVPVAAVAVPEWVGHSAEPADSDALRRAVSEAQSRVLGLQEKLNRAETQQARREAQLELQAADAAAADAARRQTEAQVRFIKVFEHPELLRKALAEAKNRLLIISPWLSPVVVNRDFLSKLEAVLRRGVHVYIGHGIEQQNDRRNKEADASAKTALDRLASRYENFHFKHFGDTHAKVLAWDSSCAVLTSFNWLSFKGDRNRGYRDEQGTVVTIASKVDEKFAEELERFN